MEKAIIPGPRWIPVFLKALAEEGGVRAACRAHGLNKSGVYKQRSRNKLFADAWDAALVGKLPDFIEAIGDERLVAPSSAGGWQRIFLDALTETSNVKAASEQANIRLSAVYALRRSDQSFARKWQSALYEGYMNLEMEVLGYLRAENPAYKMDVANAMRLLSAHRETVAREKARRGKRDKEAVLASLNAKLDKMRERKAAARRLLEQQGAALPLPNEGQQ